ncbi:outer membrane beta-barrel protein [Devosia sp. LjRoot16]|uniref:outer membrane protein n=1 Tax=Devosia sp. LjRoot16 TaxID=3342271 RepID=UPI003ECE6A5E
MNMFKLLSGAAAVALIVGTPALAADLVVDVPVDEPISVADTGWYFSVFAGGVWANNVEGDDGSAPGQFYNFDTDIGWLVGVAAGARFTDNLRGEVELSTGAIGLNDVTVDDIATFAAEGSASTTYLLGNLWFDIDTGSGFTPYIGAGLGAGFVSAEATSVPLAYSIDMSGWGWAYQVGAGVKVDVSDNIALDLGYRYKAIVDADLEGGGDDAIVNIGSHVLQAGLTFSF